MFEKKVHALARRNDLNASCISNLRAECIIPHDIYLATIDMNNGANPCLHCELVNYIQSTTLINSRTLQGKLSDMLCNANQDFINPLTYNLIDWAIGKTPSQKC